jgi:hypothetical protein
MIKHFCDQCGAEITNVSWRLQGQVRKLAFEVMTGSGKTSASSDHVMNDGDFCKYCIIDAINTLDDRARSSHD